MSVTSNQKSESGEEGCWRQYDLTARWYDLIYRDNAPDDIGFYLQRAEQADGEILELGCGTGRVTLPLAQAGHQVTGLDLSDAMLKRLELKLEQTEPSVRDRVNLIRGSMTDFELDGCYSLVIAPFRAFQHLLGIEDQRSCLACIRKHLAAGGRFIFNAFEPNVQYMYEMNRREDYEPDVEAVDEESGQLLRRAHRCRYDFANQVFDVDWRIEISDAGGSMQETQSDKMQLRWLYRWEARNLLELCGFRIVEALADYSSAPMDDELKELIFVCEAGQEN